MELFSYENGVIWLPKEGIELGFKVCAPVEFKSFSLPISILTSQETRPNDPFHMGSRGAFLLWKWLRLVAKRRHRIRVQSLSSYGIQGLQSTRFHSHKPRNQTQWSIPHRVTWSFSLMKMASSGCQKKASN